MLRGQRENPAPLRRRGRRESCSPAYVSAARSASAPRRSGRPRPTEVPPRCCSYCHLLLFRLRRLLQARDGEIEGGAFINRGFGPEVPAVLAHDPVHGGQPDAGALEVLGPMEALEYAEQFVGVFHIKADAVVADEDGAVAVLLAVA